tara:strand:- start:127 stop:303 length:177 start_codon:yes stop_codon:yes gene_type:complete
MNIKKYIEYNSSLESLLLELHTLKKVIPCNKKTISNMEKNTRNLIKDLNNCMQKINEV